MSSLLFNNNNTKAFYSMAWIAFVISSLGMMAGLIYLEAELAVKGFFAMAYLFSISSCFTLAKVIRDRHEESRIINRVETAKTEKFLNEHGNPVGTV
ncbi:MAG: YiaA/YiaB family inner membrane protein [Bacteroidota bacterium]